MPRIQQLREEGSVEAHADWLELRALTSADGSASPEDMIAEFRRSGSPEEVYQHNEQTANHIRMEALSDAALLEAADRQKACGGRYPFEIVGEGRLQLVGERICPYSFLLVLGAVDVTESYGSGRGDRLFERLCQAATVRYFSGTDGAQGFHFGHPRDDHSAFAAALEALCAKVGEGCARRDDPKTADMKDASLDLVVWRSFPDGRGGKFLAFGHCASGDNYRQKATELDASRWQTCWLTDQFHALPYLVYCVPHRPAKLDWRSLQINGGLMFDRCRLTLCAEPFSDEDGEPFVRYAEAALNDVSANNW